MLCKGIKRLQGDTTTLRLPIKIDTIWMLKDQLHHSHQYSLVEKRLLWSTFTVAFYGFLRASEVQCWPVFPTKERASDYSHQTTSRPSRN